MTLNPVEVYESPKLNQYLMLESAQTEGKAVAASTTNVKDLIICLRGVIEVDHEDAIYPGQADRYLNIEPIEVQGSVSGTEKPSLRDRGYRVWILRSYDKLFSYNCRRVVEKDSL